MVASWDRSPVSKTDAKSRNRIEADKLACGIPSKVWMVEWSRWRRNSRCDRVDSTSVSSVRSETFSIITSAAEEGVLKVSLVQLTDEETNNLVEGEHILPKCTSSPLGPQEHLKLLPKAKPASTLTPSFPLSTPSARATLAYFLACLKTGALGFKPKEGRYLSAQPTSYVKELP
jgi:hypothetical protein